MNISVGVKLFIYILVIQLVELTYLNLLRKFFSNEFGERNQVWKRIVKD